jgi:hypothetical protein
MPTPEERMQILKMIEAKQITAEEGAKLLAALGEKGRAEGDAPQPSPATSGKWFRVVDVGLKMGAKFAPAGLEGLDMQQIFAAIKTGGEGKIVDVEDEEGGEHVEVFVE